MNTQTEDAKIIEVAAAVLQRPDGSFLLAQRPPDKIWAGYWEFPGGKIESGETFYCALVRELREELGIEVETAYPWITRVFTYPHATVQLNFFRVTAWRGELHPREGQEFAWQRTTNIPQHPSCKGGSGDADFSEANLAYSVSPFEKGGRRRDFAQGGFDLTVSPILPANAPILRALELPFLYAISNANELGVEEFMLRLERALQNGLRLLQLREKHLLRDELCKLARRVMVLAHAHDARVLLNGDIELAREVEADGIQLTAAQLVALHERPDVNWCAASCHNENELRRAEALGCDFALLSPVLSTLSHPGAPHLGWGNFAAIAAGSSIPVYALGGLTHDDMQAAWRHGAHGLALLRHAWIS